MCVCVCVCAHAADLVVALLGTCCVGAVRGLGACELFVEGGVPLEKSLVFVGAGAALSLMKCLCVCVVCVLTGKFIAKRMCCCLYIASCLAHVPRMTQLLAQVLPS